nr:hypothetical protein [Acidobacteriota bacterium]
MNIYQAAGAGLLGFLTLSWILSRPVLHLQGGNFWSLFGGLAVLGTMGAAAIVWFRRAPAAESSQPAGKGGGKDEIHALDALIREAESLKGENLGVMPIFFVIGETGSIKTTTIEQSGIEAELLAGQVYQDNTVVPTRLANIWFARQFLFVEAGGSLLNDPARWQRLIRRLQPGKLRSVMNPSAQPPRAAIVCVDAAKFLQAKARESNEALARTLNARLSEISQILGVRFPVYVIFTRMDGVTFFPEFVRNLGNDESVEVFGATLPMAAATGVYAEEQTRILSSAYDDLFRSLADKRPDVLSREHDAANIPCAYEFPREFRKMRSGVTRFLVDACRPSQLRPSPFLRGFYFSGVRPVTVMDAAPAPSRRVQPEISEASEATSFFYAGGAPVEAPAAPAPAVIARRVPQWLFLRKLFAEVLLRDESAMGTSGSSAKTGRERRVLLACAAAIALVLCAGLIWSFTGNRALESRILEARILEAPRAAREDLPKLEALRVPVEQLRVWEKNRPPMGMRWGLYAGNGLLDPALRTYFHRFFGPVLFQPVAADLSAQLQGLRPVASPGGCADPAYDALKAYLITTSHPEKSSGWLATYLLNRWAEPRRMDSETRDLAARQFAFYAKELPLENPFPYANSEASDPAVIRARY